MPLVEYADDGDLALWLDDTVPDNAAQLLRSAAVRVAWACNRDPYADTPTGVDVEPLRDATCATVAAWLAVGIDPNAGGLDLQIVKATKLLSGSVDYETGGRLAAQQQAAAQIGDEARQILLSTRLLYVPGPMFDSNARLPTWGMETRFLYGGEGEDTYERAQTEDAYSWPLG